MSYRSREGTRLLQIQSTPDQAVELFREQALTCGLTQGPYLERLVLLHRRLLRLAPVSRTVQSELDSLGLLERR